MTTEFATGLLRTTITRRDGGGHRWTRSPGGLAPAPFSPVNGALDSTLAVLETPGGARLVPGRPGGGQHERTYDLGGGESVAGCLLRDGAHAGLEPAVRELGSLLAALHAVPSPVTGPRLVAPSRGGVRLERWLSGRAPQVWAAQAGAMLKDRLGPARWAMLRGWCVPAYADGADPCGETGPLVVTHGAPGLGSLVVDPSSGRAELLVGEDLCLGPWHADLGWALGEIVELSWQLGGDARQWQRLSDALQEGYGRRLGSTWPRHAAVRVALHLHDYIAYVGWHPAEFERFAAFLTFLIDLVPVRPQEGSHASAFTPVRPVPAGVEHG
ncbi:phosphotransferase family protein [Streptomyces sp. NPDC059957]|uniref:phosphotransferase family protein n=1 Tax=unclassified Streptomyces TaxID=2593676 RepID=UPI00364C1080